MSNTFGRRQFVSGAVLAFAGGALAACSAQSSSTSPSTSKKFTGYNASGEFTLWNYASQLTDAIDKTFIPGHQKLQTDVVQLALLDVQNKLLVSLAAGTGLPDSVSLSSRTSDLFLKTNSFAEWSTEELAPIKDGFGNALISYQGKVYGLPVNDGRLAMWVNNASLEKYGIDADTFTTFDAMADAGKKLNTDSKGQSKLFMVPNGIPGADYFSALVASAGGSWWDKDGKFIEDQSIAVDTLEYLVGLMKDKSIQITDWTQPTFYNLLKTEQLTSFGMNYTIGANNLPKNVPSQSGQWRMLKWPTWKPHAKQRTVSFGMTFFGALKGGNTEAAKEFAAWWFSKEGLPLLAQALGTLAYAPAAKLSAGQQKFDYFSGQQIIADMSSQPMIVPNYYNWSKTEQVVSYAVDQAILGKMSPRKAIDSCVSALSKLS